MYFVAAQGKDAGVERENFEGLGKKPPPPPPPIVRFYSFFATALSACFNVFLVIATTMDGKLFVFK